MSRVADIDRYLKAYFAAEQVPKPSPGDATRRPFVTISRQAGVGGHELADAIVDVFDAQPDVNLFGGWQVFDRTICDMVAKDRRFAASLDSLLEEEYRTKTNDFFHQMVRSTLDQKMVMDRVFLAVRTVAGIGHAVIVGRAGAQVTQDMRTGISIRVIAPEEMRIARAMDKLGLSEREARAKGRRRDAERARLVRKHFDADIDDPLGYDAVFNLALLSRRQIAETLVPIVRAKAHVGRGG